MGSITEIIDREGRRVRFYERKTPGPTKKERRAQAALGKSWCRGCLAWHAAPLVHAGLCRPCIRLYERSRYQAVPAFRESRKANASNQRAKRITGASSNGH